MSRNCLRVGGVADRGEDVRIGGGKSAMVVGGIDAPDKMSH